MKIPAPAYFIGDIHGRRDLLEGMLSFIEHHASSHNIVPTINFLGDITDRGTESMHAMELVWDTLQKWDNSRLHLGNHDEWFLAALEQGNDAPYIDSWLIHGGIATIQSYARGFSEHVLDIIRDDFPHHVEMLKNAISHRETGRFISAHAGIEPGIELSRQSEHDMRWIREPFLSCVDNTMRPVIHGHTIMGKLPVVTENRISIDTGAYRTDRLTCVFIDHTKKELSFFQTELNKVNEIDPIIEDRGQGTILDRLPDIFDMTAEHGDHENE